MDIDGFRKDYDDNPALERTMLDADPFRQFERWFNEACASGLHEPNAMSLATTDADGRPTLRTVLLKFVDADGFVFFTNYGSRKARQIEANSRVALLFPWVGMARQVAVTGTAEKISTLESARYFATRPRGSRLGAWISRQSSVIDSRALLMRELQKMKDRFRDGEIPLPNFWGGFRVRPDSIEFWQGQPNRLHDRFLYTLHDGGRWIIERLAP
ncbi:MAG: pyridoxamine 5'-phosphate oxidase [Desulfobulbus sp.]|jgi:pyridoxamine 5'-phosphate oxidase